MTVQELEKGFQEVWAIIKATDKQIDLMSKEVAQVSRNVDKLTGKWGKFVEGMVEPAVEKLFQERNIEVSGVFPRVKNRKNGRQMEIDLLLTNTDYAVLVEAKSTLKVQDVDDHLKRLDDFKDFFPEHKNKKVFGAVAGIVIEEDADRHAYQKGLFVLGQSGETMKVLNDEKFRPKTW
jgi:hypothetical protein